MTVPPPPGSTPPPPPPPMPPGPPVGGPPPMGGPQAPSNGTATAALVLGLVSLLCAGPITGIIAIVLGINGKKKAETMGGEGKGQATAGIVLGVIGTVLWIIGITLLLLGVFATSNAIDDATQDFRDSTDRYDEVAKSSHYTVSDVDVQVDSGGYITYTAYIQNDADFDTSFTVDVDCEGDLGDTDTGTAYTLNLDPGDDEKITTYAYLDSDTTSATCEIDEVRYGY